MADTKMLGDGLNLKTSAEARRGDSQASPVRRVELPQAEPRRTELPASPKSLRHIISDDQLDALKRHKTGIEQPLMWAALGVAAGSATGSVAALNAFLKSGVLTLAGFIQNMCFFSSLLAAVILMVIYLPRRGDFARLIDGLRARGE